MQTIIVNLKKIKPVEIDLIVDYLRRGKVIAYPTDTVYGLGCDARNARAVKKLTKIKGGRGGKQFIRLISDYQMLKKYCLADKRQIEYLKKIWPGPVTVIMDSRKNKNSLAVRLPKNEFLIKIISKAGFPLVSTSLNKPGEKSLVSVKNLVKHFKYLPDLTIDAGNLLGKPSKLVDIRDIKKIVVLRK